jgi:hypothetical protein
MDVFTLGCIGWTLVFQLGERSEAQAQGNQARIEEPHLEDIYIVRSVRESRTTLPTEFCAPTTTNFSAAFEDQYTLRSTATASSDGRLIDSNAATVGTFTPVLAERRILPSSTSMQKLNWSAPRSKVSATVV